MNLGWVTDGEAKEWPQGRSPGWGCLQLAQSLSSQAPPPECTH